MKTIVYSPTQGRAFPDALAERAAREFLGSPQRRKITVSTENFVYAVRVLVSEGVHPNEDVVFLYENETITVSRYGTASRYPPGFHDSVERWLHRLIDAQLNHAISRGSQ